MAIVKLSTKTAALIICGPREPAPAHLPSNVFSLGQARVNRETAGYLKGRI